MPPFRNSFLFFLVGKLLFCPITGFAQIGIFAESQDVGKPAQSGSATYQGEDQSYMLRGAGYNIWFERDEFHYLFRHINGDFILTAEFDFEGKGVDPHRKVGWMIRPTTSEQEMHMSATLHGDGLTVLQWRALPGAFMRDPQDEIFAPKGHYSILQLERQGKNYIFRAAHPGEPLQWIGAKELVDMPDQVLAGLFICSHNAAVIEQARVRNVRIELPVPEDYNAYQQGRRESRLEILNVENGMRKIIHRDTPGFEAPNWLPGVDRLLFNQEGLLYTISTDGDDLQVFDTGFANRNNNDHGISFDGKMLAISHHRSDLPGGGSTIYVMPLEGGEPKLVTEQTPSYWHGWSADGSKVYFTGRRGDAEKYQIFQADIKTGEETQLTHILQGHVDGPESDPSGAFIYYNSSETGTMQIWRMRPDGSEAEQITFDEYNDWFPHISPDGQWLAFLSYLPLVHPNDHPFYKRVMLRLMPVDGGAPKVIAHFYGGQGSINVPSWSPDSKRLAFVSNSF